MREEGGEGGREGEREEGRGINYCIDLLTGRWGEMQRRITLSSYEEEN